jgi:hypothetical protein
MMTAKLAHRLLSRVCWLVVVWVLVALGPESGAQDLSQMSEETATLLSAPSTITESLMSD